MSDKITSIKIAGLGGMGVLTSTQILAEVFVRQGLDDQNAMEQPDGPKLHD